MPASGPTAINPIRLFLASPGDVKDERRVVRDVAGELNGPLRRHGWEIELLGWEDRGPTGGRAQADINADVERCHIFIGILWQRWGTPTGTATSGFAEEWGLAHDRFKRSGAPDLWLYFKRETDSSRPADPAELARVEAFRSEVESAEAAFYKSFDDLAAFEKLVRERLTDEVFRRSGLTRTDLGILALDWTSAYREDPTWLLPRGRDRETLAAELATNRPEAAAHLWGELADESERAGLQDKAESLRMKASQALIAAGLTDAAVASLRRILAEHVWWLRLDETRRIVDRLDDAWPPELASELRGWRACSRAAADHDGAASALAEGLTANHAFALDEVTRAQWTVILWRCDLHRGVIDRITAEDVDLNAISTEVALEMGLLWADGLRAAFDPRADDAWATLRLRAVEDARRAPARSAWIATRVAMDLVNQGNPNDAEIAYVDAATRWSAAPGGHEQAALAFFSAQAAAQLSGEWSFRGWGLREALSTQRSSVSSFSQRAARLEEAARVRRAHKDGDSSPMLTSAMWMHQRAGLLDGVMHDISLLADEHASAGRHIEAVAMYCRAGDSERARTTSRAATQKRALTNAMRGEWPTWSTDARCEVLSIVGRAADANVARELLSFVVPALTPSGRTFDNSHRSAAEALAELALAVDTPSGESIQILTDCARSADYTIATAGRYGLRMLYDIGRLTDVRLLIERFATDTRPVEPSPAWVAEHLRDPDLVAPVRRAALENQLRPLTALLCADMVAADDELREFCRRATRRMLNSHLGITPDGAGIAGLLALDIQGAIAAATENDELKADAAEALLGYALETRWPMNNRVSAVGGVWQITKRGGDSGWLDRLRPLAEPDADLDDDSPQHLQMWAERGDLEAVAIKACVSYELPDAPPPWLEAVVREARFDRRAPMRAASWFAAARHPGWFQPESARHALADPSTAVRTAALHSWRDAGTVALPETTALSLAGSSDVATRLALISVMERLPNLQAIEKLQNDDDAYVRGLARRDLRGGSDPD